MKSLFADSVKRIDIFAVASVIVPLFIYLMTLAPSVTFFDSGEFVTAIYSLGSAHSPGYPLFVNYAKPFTYLPFGNIAFRVNYATSVSAAVACYSVFLLVSHMLQAEVLPIGESANRLYKRIIAFCAALTFAFSARLWLQSNHDKPYPIVSFLAAIIFYLLLLWRDRYHQGEERIDYVYLAVFLCGLGFSAHQTMVLLIPSFVYLIFSVNWRLLGRVKEIILCLAFGLIGFSVHLHLPLRATQNPLLNWGDPKTWTQFLWHFLRKGYPSEPHDRDLELLWAQINAFSIPYEFTTAGFLLLIVGCVCFLKKRRHEVLAYLLGILVFLLVIVGYFNALPDLIFLTEEFFTPLYLLSAVFIGLGLFFLINQALIRLPVRLSSRLVVRLFLIAVPFALPVAICSLNYRENDQHENYVAFDYASNSLRSLPQRAVMYTWGDSGAFPLWYLQGVEKMREDVDLLHTPHLVFKWYLDSFPQLFRNSRLRDIPDELSSADNALKISISEMIGWRPVYVDFSTRYSLPLEPYGMTQKGICYQLHMNGQGVNPPDLSLWSLYSLRGLGNSMFFRDLDTVKAFMIYANSHMEAGDTLLSMGRITEGLSELKTAETISPELHNQIAQIIRSKAVLNTK